MLLLAPLLLALDDDDDDDDDDAAVDGATDADMDADDDAAFAAAADDAFVVFRNSSSPVWRIAYRRLHTRRTSASARRLQVGSEPMRGRFSHARMGAKQNLS